MFLHTYNFTQMDICYSSLVTPSPAVQGQQQQNPFYMLKKDSERRDALAAILLEAKADIVEQWHALLAKDLGGSDNVALNQVFRHRYNTIALYTFVRACC